MAQLRDMCFVSCRNLEHVLLPSSTTPLYTRTMFVATPVLSLDYADGISDVWGYFSALSVPLDFPCTLAGMIYAVHTEDTHI